LRAKGDTERHVGQVVACCEALFEGAQFACPADLELSRATAWLSSLRADKPVAELPADQQEWTPGEAAKLLGVVRRVVSAAVARHGLPTNRKDGKARRLPRATVQALLDRAARGAAPETVNHYVAAVRSFCRWMVKPARRLPFNPLDGLAMLNVRTDRRHDRRELAAEELRRLLAAARSSGRSWRGLDGNARYHLYATACGTGFRAGALASLTPECFDLSGDRPTVTLAARFNKSRKTKVQHLPPDVAGLLRAYLDGKPAGQPVWPGAWASEKGGAAMLRIDLEAADIPYVVDGPEGPLYADFHALRHSYLTLGAAPASTCARSRSWLATARRSSPPGTPTSACTTRPARSRSCPPSCPPCRRAAPSVCKPPAPMARHRMRQGAEALTRCLHRRAMERAGKRWRLRVQGRKRFQSLRSATPCAARRLMEAKGM
jgi:excisionase family DNA binding protein